MESSFIIENLKSMKNLIDGSVVLGEVIELAPNVKIVPVFKVKVSYFMVETSIKENAGNGSNGNISLTPVCLLQLNDGNVRVLSLKGTEKLDFFDKVPNMFQTLTSNIDIGSLLNKMKN